MAFVEQGSTVKLHYTGKLENGTVFDSSVSRGEPLEFTVGEGRLLPEFEAGVVGMTPGDQKTIGITHDNAYGPYRDEMVLKLPRQQLPEELDVEVGRQLQLSLENGQTVVVNVTEVSDAEVTLDANHPLAGEDLTFDLELVEIV